MANRVKATNDHSKVGQWQYNPSKSNPTNYDGLKGLEKVKIRQVGTEFFENKKEV